MVRLTERTLAGVETAVWGPGLRGALETLSATERVPLSITLLGAFKVLLHRYTGQEEVVVTASVSERGASARGRALRTDLAGGPSFRDFLHRLHAEATRAQASRASDAGRLEAELGPLSGHGRRFRALFELEDEMGASLDLSASDALPPPTPHELGLRIRREADGLNASLTYDRQLFDPSTAGPMLGHLQALLEGIAAEPDTSISKLPLLTEAERHRLLVEWSGLQVRLPETGLCIHELFEEQAERAPDVLAVVGLDGSLTYGELDRQANRLAHRLRTMGVGPEILVGLCVERSLEMLVGIFGILKAGGAYVPLDPAYPAERLAFMLKDADVPVLLTQTALVDRLPGHSARVVCLDHLARELDGVDDSPVASGVTPENLAYVIYTSGSTGTPKGALTTHRSMVKYAKVATLRFGIHPGDRLLQFCSISFDISVEEIFLCLTRGGTLVLRTPEMLGSVPVFLQECERLAISVLSLPTAFWHEIAACLGNEVSTLPPSLGLVIIGGERVQPERLARWSAHVGRRPRLLNTYGLTEASVLSTMYDLTGLAAPPPGEARDVPIGRPVDGVETYILDHHLQPVPVGVPGELCIGGAHLARGYLNSPTVTAERFVPSPFASPVAPGEPQPRLYRTGDLVRYSHDGQIQYIGRIDQQVKVRGFRVEPGEIEALLNQHPVVSEAVVVARRDDAGRNALIAYLVPEPGAGFIESEVRAHLKRQLPEYMVPSAFVVLEALPLSPNGKVDRAALPAPSAPPERAEVADGPATEVERLIAETWQEALQIGSVSVHDNFFDLGGYSLLLVGVIGKIEDKLGVRLLPDDFAVQTLGQIAAVCEEQMRAVRRPELVGFFRRVLRGIRGG